MGGTPPLTHSPWSASEMPHHVEKSRHGLYYLRLPKRLAHFNGGKRICLKTHSKRLAIARARHHIHAIDLCMSLNVSSDTDPQAAYSATKAEFARDLQSENDQLDAVLQRASSLPDSSHAVKLALERRLRNVIVEQAYEFITQRLENASVAPGLTPFKQTQVLDALLTHAENVELDFSGRRAPDGRLSSGSLELVKQAYRHEIYDAYLELVDHARSTSAELPQSPVAPPPRSASVEPLSSAPVTFIELNHRQELDVDVMKGGSSLATKQEYRRYARILTILAGNRSVQHLTQEDFKKLHRQLLDIKKGAARHIVVGQSTVADLIPEDGSDYEKISPQTAASYSVRLAALHEFAYKNNLTHIHHDKIEKPSFDLIATKRRKETSIDETKEHSYRPDELQAIFDGYIYRPQEIGNRKEVHPFHFWMPLIAIYTGMRINEMAGLTVGAMDLTDGIWNFKIEEDTVAGRTLKNVTSKRRIPVHQHLIDLGFIDYVQDRKKAKKVMLFDGLYDNARNGWGNAATRFFTRIPSKTSPGTGYFYDVGVHQKAHDGKTVHSFRHTLIDQLRACGIDSDYDIEALTGHQKSNVSEADRYGDGPHLRQKAAKLNKVHYPELDLSHVSYKQFKEFYKAKLARSLRAFEKERQKQKTATS